MEDFLYLLNQFLVPNKGYGFMKNTEFQLIPEIMPARPEKTQGHGV